MEKQPESIARLKPLIPQALDHVILRCLAKQREDRWQSAHDLKLELQWINDSRSQSTWAPGAIIAAPATPRRTLLFWAALSLLIAAITGIVVWMLKPMPRQQVSRAVITLPPGQHLAELEEPALALSNDGTKLAYVAVQGETQQIYLRSMDNPQPRAVADTIGGTNPFFSPDGQWLGFFSDQKLKKVSLTGEAVVTLADVPTKPHGATWNTQGMIVFSSMQIGPLQHVPDSGGTPQDLTHFDRGEVSHRGPDFLPGGRAFLFAATRGSYYWTNAHIAVQSLESGIRQTWSRAQPFHATHPLDICYTRRTEIFWPCPSIPNA